MLDVNAHRLELPGSFTSTRIYPTFAADQLTSFIPMDPLSSESFNLERPSMEVSVERAFRGFDL